jgi:hypothetical protein
LVPSSDHRPVDADLVAGVEADQGGARSSLSRWRRPWDALAAVAFLVAVAQFERLVLAGAGPGGHGGAAEGAAGESDVDLDRSDCRGSR